MDRTGQSLLGKYQLTRMLGKGGMGEVWLGEHSLTGRKVAVKILSDNYLQNKKVVARFGREARAASSVHHPGIVEILDQDRTPDGVPFLVMEFLEGESVGERIRRCGKLLQDEALGIMLPLLDALDAAHQSGVIHRDLKPDNVFILPGARGEERIKILDFGISQKSDEIENRLTQEGSVLGTPHYMSPEQAKGEPGIDGRVDVYAASVMFYECVVGDVPFDAGNYNALMLIILGTPPPSPRSRGAEISSAVEQVLLAAMDKNRNRRPPSARAFHDLLLEAGMQEEDAMLDIETWSFSSPSEPPPPIDFGDFSEEGDPFFAPGPVAARPPKPHVKPDRDAPPQPAPSPARRVPAPPPSAKRGRADEHDDLEADIFGSPSTGKQQFDSLKPPASTRAPARGPNVALRGPQGAPGPRGPAFDAGPGGRGGPPFDPAPARGAPFEGPQPPRPSPQYGAPAARPAASVRPPRRAVAPAGGFQLDTPAEEPTLGRKILNWSVTLAAIAGLAYLMQIVFTRPDPRKDRQQMSQPAVAPSVPPEAR